MNQTQELRAIYYVAAIDYIIPNNLVYYGLNVAERLTVFAILNDAFIKMGNVSVMLYSPLKGYPLFKYTGTDTFSVKGVTRFLHP